MHGIFDERGYQNNEIHHQTMVIQFAHSSNNQRLDEIEQYGDDLIEKYIHKKFDAVQKEDDSSVDNAHNVKKIKIFNNTDLEQQSTRRSVIVRRDKVEQPQILLQLHLDTEGGVQLGQVPLHEQILSINIQEIENLYFLEEEKYFDNLQNIFDQRWNMIPVGERIMTQYIGFCEDKSFQTS